MTGLFARLWRDEEGVILPYVTVMLVVFIGVAALALDGTRAMSLQTQMQKAADALAIAGAAELDRLSTSTQRATNAINSMVTNSSLFSGNVAVQSIRFLAYDGNPWNHPALAVGTTDNMQITTWMCSSPCTTASMSQAARYVEVVVTPITLPAIMPIRYVNQALGNLGAGASAMAAMDQVSCGLTPIFICNPFEGGTASYDAATAALEAAAGNSTLMRRLIALASPSGPSATWGPGDFGYLTPEPGTLPSDSCFPNASEEIGKAMGMDSPLVCVRQNGVDLQPGNANAAKDGLNSRFGVYNPSFSAACRIAYPPDENVRKGMKPGPGNDWCRAVPDGFDSNGPNQNWPPGDPLSFHALPADSCLLNSTCPSPTPNIGASNWDCMTYWTNTHSVNTAAMDNPPPGCTDNTATRWKIYDHENSTGYKDDLAQAAPMADREKGVPQCTGPTPRSKRREINVAIINCQHSPVTIRSNAENVPVAAFGKFFLTHATTTHSKPYAEFMGLIDRGSNTVRDQVQLIR